LSLLKFQPSYVTKDVRICAYFSKLKAVCHQKGLGNTALDNLQEHATNYCAVSLRISRLQSHVHKPFLFLLLR